MDLHILSTTTPWRRSLKTTIRPLSALCLGILLGAALPSAAQAQGSRSQTTAASEDAGPSLIDLRPNIKQPYIVKKGDTLWDIAHHFFKHPQKWLKIWEQNLYITNPDLIYPGNKIWFAPRATKSGGLKISKATPQVHLKAAERFEEAVDTSMVVTALQRQDFIRPEAVDAAGYVLDSPDDRINYGASDRIYMKFASPVEEDSIFDIFRRADPVRDPSSGKLAGMLVKHLGQVRITGSSGGVTQGIVIRAFEEISRSDRLKPARNINTRVQPDYPVRALNGNIMYIRNNATEAGQNQIVGINLGEKDGLKPGTVLKVLKAGRTVEDHVSGKDVTLPQERIGELIVLAPQNNASIALVSHSTNPINIGDAVRNSERP
ncbi:MAG: LysM peptidoglycan-binding domain-containing protein [Mariprofundaceae bacterium]|nr:LysM peptidoglycan-binding domain-containing protein [Mariprofundaceae bacterium]